MSLIMQSHGGTEPAPHLERRGAAVEAGIPAGGDVSVDAVADFGCWFGPEENLQSLPDNAIAQLDELGRHMVPARTDSIGATPDGVMAPIFTYWGQFLDHELTARTDRDTEISVLTDEHPRRTRPEIEVELKNARSPRFDLDSVYGGVPIGADLVGDAGRNAARLIAALRHPNPALREKMRVGPTANQGSLPDNLDPARDLPRFQQVDQATRDAFLALAQQRLSAADFAKLQAGLPKRALIGDMRNDENLVIAQFHLSFLRFHNKAIDYLAANDTGWPASYDAARTLTRLHYQWLIERVFLRNVCDGDIVDQVLANRAEHFVAFRSRYNLRHPSTRRGSVLPLEFSVAAYRYGHTMVRNVYDFNKSFGRPNAGAPFDDMFKFTGNGGFDGLSRLPRERVADWRRLAGVEPMDSSDGKPARVSRAIDTRLAPPLGDLVNEGKDQAGDTRDLFRHLARRNLRRGFALRLPTGQALHQKLKDTGAIQSNPITDVAAVLTANQDLKTYLQSSPFNDRTPLWFYILAEAEAAGGNRLGELGSFLVASVFIGVLLDDPDSALSTRFEPAQSPLRLPGGGAIDSIAGWLRFAAVMPG